MTPFDPTVYRAVIFDMDGVLIDSEPLWRRVEIEVFQSVGVPMTDAMCRQTQGLRVDEVVKKWRAVFPWEGVSDTEIVDRLVTGVVELIRREGTPMPWATEAVRAVRASGRPIGLATSSFPPIIAAVLERLGLEEAFDAIRSAQDEPYGKPHPGIFLSTAARLGVVATDCLVLEDSLNGVIAAKAARMACVALPDAHPPHPGFAIADAVWESLAPLAGENR